MAPRPTPAATRRDGARRFVLVGGSGPIGAAIAPVLQAAGAEVIIVDHRPPERLAPDQRPAWIECDLLTGEVDLPDGEVVLLNGSDERQPRWPWTLPLDSCFATARLLPALAGRDVTLISTVEIYGAAQAPFTEDTAPVLPWEGACIEDWCDEVRSAARRPCPPWRVADLCRRLASADCSGRRVYGLARYAQELLVTAAVPEERRTILRLANPFGVGLEGGVARLARRALANRPLPVTPGARQSFVPVEELGRILLARLPAGTYNVGGPAIATEELASIIASVCGSSSTLQPVESDGFDYCGEVDMARLRANGIRLPALEESLGTYVDHLRRPDVPLFVPPLPIVIPPRPARPDELADRQAEILWRGRVKHGNRWSRELSERLRAHLGLADGDELLLTTSGTEALRLAIVATVGPARPGEVAVLPSFTYPATADVLVQLGYALRFVDVDPRTWTLDAAQLERALAEEAARLVVCVDTFGNPCDYAALCAVCSRAGVPLVADSAAALGSRHAGRPVGAQADAHAFSMSFAKVLSAAGAGGAVALRSGAARADLSTWLGSALMDELHAVAALEQLDALEELVERRAQIAAIYAGAAERLEDLTAQCVAPGNRHSYVHWVARVRDRAMLARKLARLGVETREYFRALHLRANEGHCARLPVTEMLDAQALALPMSSELTERQAETVVAALEFALAESARA